MEDKIADGASEHARNYGWDNPLIQINTNYAVQ